MEFDELQRMHHSGASPEAIYRRGKLSGLTQIESYRMLRSVCGLSLQEAKTVIVAADTGMTLAQHQSAMADAFEELTRNSDSAVRESDDK